MSMWIAPYTQPIDAETLVELLTGLKTEWPDYKLVVRSTWEEELEVYGYLPECDRGPCYLGAGHDGDCQPGPSVRSEPSDSGSST